MDVLGVGVDAIDLAEIEEMLRAESDLFLASFTAAEIEYAGSGVHRIERLAGRYAAKEAVVKALGIGWGNGVDWSDIEIVKRESGEPVIVLRGEVLEIATEHGVAEWFLSLTHSASVAVAVAIATRERRNNVTD